MNDNYSKTELKYINRWQSLLLKNALSNYPVVIITGARQVGKSTFLRNDVNLKDWKYITLDEFDLLKQSRNEPESLWIDSDRIIIDEAQKSPDVLSAIKKAIDSNNNKKQFILSGSANLLLMRRVTETLAGRASYIVLPPMAYSEKNGLENNRILERLFSEENIKNNFSPLSISETLIRGFMPPLLRFKNIEDIPGWWESYSMTYLERDLRELSQVGSLIDFRNLMQILALRTARVLNQSEVARDSSISQPTTHRYINLLQTSHIIEVIPAFFKNRTKRLVKSPKIYWIDPSMAIYLAGYYDKKSLESSREYGLFFESLVYHHIRILANLLKPKANIYHYRTIGGQEVDFIIEYGNKLIAMEVKMSDKVKYDDLKNIRMFLQEYPETLAGIIIYNGTELKYLDKKIIAVPISNIL
jgi:predicted AAA+ superfamily ATPase